MIDRVLAIMKRRAALMGLDLRPALYGGEDGAIDPSTIKIEIVGNPEPQRVKWLETEVLRLRELEADITPTEPPSTTLN